MLDYLNVFSPVKVASLLSFKVSSEPYKIVTKWEMKNSPNHPEPVIFHPLVSSINLS